ncbi:MAG: hypothetical protein L0219_15625 [Phycisphaerales bacterium]|nr:hypothetical protein [Phycisphaerales bacterium]
MLKHALCLLIALGLLSTASAEPVRGIHSRIGQPIAPRGSVLLLPLTAKRPGDHWPPTLNLELESGQNLTGTVAWIEPASPTFLRNWTDDPRDLAVRAVFPDDDSSTSDPAGPLGPYLLARLPIDGAGAITLNEQTLTPTWHDVPDLPSLLFGEEASTWSDEPQLPLIPSPDRPDPVSPFEYWRWTLLADRLEMRPPRPFGGDVERLVAEGYAALWRIGLDRLKAQSQGIAQECRLTLTKTCIDRRQPLAAWIADPEQTGSLLSRLLDFSTPDTTALTNAVEWLDRQAAMFIWKESEAADAVGLNAIVPHDEPLVARFTWPGADTRDTTVQLEPGVLTSISIERPPRPKPPAIGLAAPAEPTRQVLQVDARGRAYYVPIGPRALVARPPGVFFHALSPPLTLAQVQGVQQSPLPANQASFLSVRRLGGRWEVFVDCRRPPRADPDSAPSQQSLPHELRSYHDLRGHEAITILLGPADAAAGVDETSTSSPQVWLTIPENGFHRVIKGSNDGTLQIHKASHPDRWYCRIVLPESWFSAEQTNPALIGAIRSHDDSVQLETGPRASLPWRPEPSRATLDLQPWDDLPQPDDQFNR